MNRAYFAGGKYSLAHAYAGGLRDQPIVVD